MNQTVATFCFIHPTKCTRLVNILGSSLEHNVSRMIDADIRQAAPPFFVAIDLAAFRYTGGMRQISKLQPARQHREFVNCF